MVIITLATFVDSGSLTPFVDSGSLTPFVDSGSLTPFLLIMLVIGDVKDLYISPGTGKVVPRQSKNIVHVVDHFSALYTVCI